MSLSDLTHVAWVEVIWDSNTRRLWVNGPDGNLFRCYNVGAFHYNEMPRAVRGELTDGCQGPT
jgi:hypothetical protein